MELSSSVLPNLGSPDVLGLQLLEILASTAGDEVFWEVESKTQVWEPLLYVIMSLSLLLHKAIERINWGEVDIFHLYGF